MNKVASSFLYKFIERFSVKGIGLIIGIVLARLLSPTVFGEIAIIMVFVNLSITVVQTGLSTALVQNKDVKDEDYSTVFFINFVVSLILIAILFFVAPLVGQLYKNDGLILPLRVYAFSLLFCSFNSIQTAKLQREMKFLETMISTLVATVLSGTIGIVFAIKNPTIWALIVYYFSNTVFSSIAMGFASKWMPKLVFSWQRAKVLFSYGWKMLVSGLLCSIYGDIRSLIIGKVYSEEALGYYSKGMQFPDIVSNTVDNSIQGVMFPIMSQSQEDKAKLKETLKKSIAYVTFFVFPAMLGMLAVAEPFVRSILTDKWADSIIYIRILSLGYMFTPIVSSELVCIKSTGNSMAYMISEIIRRVMMMVVLLISLFAFHSVEAIAWGFVVSSFLDVIIVTLFVQKEVKFSFKDLLISIFNSLLCAILMGVGVFFLPKLIPNNLVVLILQILLGAVLYIAFCFLFKNKTFAELKTKVLTYFHK